MTGPKWASTRAFFGAMAAEAPVVRSAIMAFAAMQMQRGGMSGEALKTDWRPIYDTAARQLSAALSKRRKAEGSETPRSGLKHILASLFLLTYTDVSQYRLSYRSTSLTIATAPHRNPSTSPC